MATLVIYRGLPGSGKTTQAAHQQSLYGGTLAGRDHVRSLMFGKLDLTNEQEFAISTVQDTMIREGLRQGHNVYVDDMNLRNTYVRKLVNMARAEDAEWEIVDLTYVPLDVCVNRDAARERSVGINVICDLHNRFIQGRGLWPLPVSLDPIKSDEPTFAPYVPRAGAKPAIMVDIDGTLAHCGDRDIYDGSRAYLDTPDRAVTYLIKKLVDADWKLTVLFCSGRSDTHRDVTAQWIMEHTGVYVDEEFLFMRKAGDDRKDSIVKLELFDEHIRDEYDVLFVLDDRQQVVDAWRSIGLKVFQVAEGNF